MARQTLRYECSVCGNTYTYDREEIKGNSLIAKIWGDQQHVWPVWAICSECIEERSESNKMWPASVRGPKKKMTCDSCSFSVRYPKALLKGEEDSFKCPKCGGGVVS